MCARCDIGRFSNDTGLEWCHVYDEGGWIRLVLHCYECGEGVLCNGLGSMIVL